jgi:hypothetical protein
MVFDGFAPHLHFFILTKGHIMKRYSRILFSVVLALMLLASCAPTNTGSVSPEKQDEIQNMSGYLDKLVAEGLTIHVQIFAEDGEPYIFLQDVQGSMLISSASFKTFESATAFLSDFYFQ